MNAKPLLVVPALILGFAGLAACGGGGGGTKTAAEGTWLADCDADFASGTSEQTSFRVSGLKYDRVNSIYADTSCETLATERIQRGTFTQGDAIEVPGRPNAFPVDLSWNETLIINYIDAVAESLNGRAFCGITNWEANVLFDVSDCVELVGSDPYPRLAYDLYLVDGDEMFLGIGGISDTPEGRPSAASSVNSLTRKE